MMCQRLERSYRDRVFTLGGSDRFQSEPVPMRNLFVDDGASPDVGLVRVVRPTRSSHSMSP